MQLVLFDARWEGEIVLSEEVIDYLKEKGVKSVALFASVNFLNLDTVKKQLADLGIEIMTTKAKRTHVELQILGCDAYHDSFKENIIDDADVTLYIGDGMFHPKALLLSQLYQKEIRQVVIWDPVNEEMKIIDKGTIQAQIDRLKANLKKFISARVVGILVTTKPGQQYLGQAKKLKEKLENEGKKAYIFIDDTLDLNQFGNYPFIDAWVNTGCPRIGFDDITTIEKPLLNVREAIDPVKALEDLER